MFNATSTTHTHIGAVASIDGTTPLRSHRHVCYSVRLLARTAECSRRRPRAQSMVTPAAAGRGGMAPCSQPRGRRRSGGGRYGQPSSSVEAIRACQTNRRRACREARRRRAMPIGYVVNALRRRDGRTASRPYACLTPRRGLRHHRWRRPPPPQWLGLEHEQRGQRRGPRQSRPLRRCARCHRPGHRRQLASETAPERSAYHAASAMHPACRRRCHTTPRAAVAASYRSTRVRSPHPMSRHADGQPPLLGESVARRAGCEHHPDPRRARDSCRPRLERAVAAAPVSAAVRSRSRAQAPAHAAPGRS